MNKVVMQEMDDPAITPVAEKEISAWDALWSFFSSMKTAIVLLLLLVAVAVVGTILEDRTGTSIYGTPWFEILLGLMGVNLTVCTINRTGMTWRKTFHPDVDATPASVERMRRSEKLNYAGSAEEAAEKISSALRSRSYWVVRRPGKSEGGTVALYASRGRLGLWGPHLTHVSLLVIFLGAIYGNYTGSDGFTMIVEGGRPAARYNVKGSKEQKPLGFEVACNSFSIKYDKHHNPAGYRSDLQVMDGGKPVARKVVDVNHPLAYKGYSFYQSDYGLVGMWMRITAPNGQSVRIPFDIATNDTEQGRTYAIAGNPFQSVQLGGKTLTLFVHNLVPDYVPGSTESASPLPRNPAVNVLINDHFEKDKSLKAWSQMGWMAVSKSANYKGFTVTFDRVVSYTGLQVNRNPGLPLVYLGFALMVLGVVLSFYVTHKIVRVTVTQPKDASRKDGAGVVIGAVCRMEPDAFDKDFQRVREALA